MSSGQFDLSERHVAKPLTKEEMQQAKYGLYRRVVSCDMTYLDRRDHYHSLYYNKMVCAPGFGTAPSSFASPTLFSTYRNCLLFDEPIITGTLRFG